MYSLYCRNVSKNWKIHREHDLRECQKTFWEGICRFQVLESILHWTGCSMTTWQTWGCIYSIKGSWSPPTLMELDGLYISAFSLQKVGLYRLVLVVASNTYGTGWIEHGCIQFAEGWVIQVSGRLCWAEVYQ